MAKKKKLPFNPKKLDRGSGVLYKKMNALAKEWNLLTTPAGRRKEIERVYKACNKQWDKLKKTMAKHGIHIGNL